MSENGEIYTADKNFTLPPALTALTNSTSDLGVSICPQLYTLHIVYLGVSKIDKVQYRLQFWPFEPSQEDQRMFVHISQ